MGNSITYQNNYTYDLEFIYLIQLKEHIGTNIYKFGKTTNNVHNGVEVYFIYPCENSNQLQQLLLSSFCENDKIELVNNSTNCKGDLKDIINVIINTIYKSQKYNKSLKSKISKSEKSNVTKNEIYIYNDQSNNNKNITIQNSKQENDQNENQNLKFDIVNKIVKTYFGYECDNFVNYILNSSKDKYSFELSYNNIKIISGDTSSTIKIAEGKLTYSEKQLIFINDKYPNWYTIICDYLKHFDVTMNNYTIENIKHYRRIVYLFVKPIDVFNYL